MVYVVMEHFYRIVVLCMPFTQIAQVFGLKFGFSFSSSMQEHQCIKLIVQLALIGLAVTCNEPKTFYYECYVITKGEINLGSNVSLGY